MPRLDMHMHTAASFDCQVPALEVARRCRALGLSPVVITDHDTVDGALVVRAAGFDVVVGQEITTTEGELIGLYLTELIPAGLSPEETAREVKRQGGLVYLQHPYDRRRRCLDEASIERIADLVDIVEVFNGRSLPAMNARADGLRETIGAAPGAGSDAHALAEIGSAYIDVPPFDGPEGLLAALHDGRVVTGRHPAVQRAKRLFGR